MENNMNFDARKTMGELNYLIEGISEFWEQRNYLRQELMNRRGLGLFGFLSIILFMVGFFLLLYSLLMILEHLIPDASLGTVEPFVGILGITTGIAAGIGLILYGRKLAKKDKKVQRENEIIKLLKSKEKELDNFIKQEWNPRIKMLKNNSASYFSDKELRDKYNEFMQADREVRKLTRAGRRMQEFTNGLKVAGIVTVAVTGVALGGMSAANKQFDKQYFFDH